jgi:NAD(P)-dependent dehydrogenase (short-subunit alcohol dehydrogenase family)
MMTRQREGKVALITGESSGIGVATARLAGAGRCSGGAGLPQRGGACRHRCRDQDPPGVAMVVGTDAAVAA